MAHLLWLFIDDSFLWLNHAFENLKSDYHCCKDGLGGAGVAIKGKKGCCFGRLYELDKYTCFFDVRIT